MSLRGIPSRGRMVLRHLAQWEPHFFRERGQWVCHARLGPVGYGSTIDEALADWHRARMQWANTVPAKTDNTNTEQGKSRQLMAHVGLFTLER